MRKAELISLVVIGGRAGCPIPPRRAEDSTPYREGSGFVRLKKFSQIATAIEAKKAPKVSTSAAGAVMGQGRTASQTCLMKELGRSA